MSRSIFKNFLGRFSRDEGGSVSVEFVLMFPVLFWVIMACYTYFDGYRQSAANLKAAFTISDLISRETAGINETYIDSMQRLLNLMTRSQSATKVRISVIRWDEEDDRYYVDWSRVRGYKVELTNATIGDMAERLPTMPDEERVILIETSNTYVPPFKVGINEMEMDNFVFTRPRFTNQVAWAS